MPKNGCNHLKFGHNMYYDDFYHFPKFCQNLLKNGDFFAKKHTNFSNFTARFLVRSFQRKKFQVLGKWSNWANIWYKCTLGYVLQCLGGTFGYFCHSIGTDMCK